MADKTTVRVLERKIAVARRELNNLRRDVNSLKKMLIQKFNEVKELLEKGEISTINTISLLYNDKRFSQAQNSKTIFPWEINFTFMQIFIIVLYLQNGLQEKPCLQSKLKRTFTSFFCLYTSKSKKFLDFDV